VEVINGAHKFPKGEFSGRPRIAEKSVYDQICTVSKSIGLKKATKERFGDPVTEKMGACQMAILNLPAEKALPESTEICWLVLPHRVSLAFRVPLLSHHLGLPMGGFDAQRFLSFGCA
jgi:hypothetical protein